jgi:hypothetical protein
MNGIDAAQHHVDAAAVALLNIYTMQRRLVCTASQTHIGQCWAMW